MVATTSGLVAGIAAAFLYLVGTLMQLRRLSQSTPIVVKPLLGLAIPAVLLHGVTTYWAINTANGIHLGLFTTSGLVTFVMATFVLLASLRLPVPSRWP